MSTLARHILEGGFVTVADKIDELDFGVSYASEKVRILQSDGGRYEILESMKTGKCEMVLDDVSIGTAPNRVIAEIHIATKELIS